MAWKGPFAVTEKIYEDNFKVNVRGKIRTYHANLLKKYHPRDDPEVTSERSRKIIED